MNTLTGKRLEDCAYFYCITEDMFHTAVIDRENMVIGNSKEAEILIQKDWIGSKAGIVEGTGRGVYYYHTVPGTNVFINGKLIQMSLQLQLDDMDTILICGHNTDEWLLLWFREDCGKLRSSWNFTSLESAMKYLPLEKSNGRFHILYSRDQGSRILVNNSIISGNVFVCPGMTIRLDTISGVFTGKYFYYQEIKTRHAEKADKPVRESVTQSAASKEYVQEVERGKGILSIDIEEKRIRSLLMQKVILRDIHLDIYSGQMVLVLGGSGAGKTTFMNAVIGYEKAKGVITYNGRQMDMLRKNRSMIGFVPQTDILRQGDTVGKTIRNAAEMKLPDYILNNPEKLNDRIKHTLNLMGLGEKERDLVSKLSGGEKKRLAVAIEYIGDPLLFFLDEPDSGLDGSQARKLMGVLRSIADEGRIVLIISHSPDRASALFDRVIVLGKNKEKQCGELTFYGTVERAKSFFDADDLEGIMDILGIAGSDRSGEYVKKYRNLQPGRGGLE